MVKKTNENAQIKSSKTCTLNQGITLIALIITIIILLILAGVTISLTLGENGLFKTAKQTAENYSNAKAKEEIEIAWATCEAKYWSDKTQDEKVVKSAYFTKDALNEALGNSGEVSNIETDESETYLVTYISTNNNKTYVFRIDENGNVEIITGIVINKIKTTLQIIDGVAETENLQATLLDITGNITWESSNTSVATVDSSGVVTAVGEGTTIITARCGEYSSTCEVTVKSVISISSIEIQQNGEAVSELELIGGEATTLIAVVNSGATEDVIWECSDTSKVAIEASGNGNRILTVQGIATTSSSVTITAKNSTGTVIASCSITVRILTLTEVSQTELLVGDYVVYNVPYIDMYTDYEFSKYDGWRFLKVDESGNTLLISTGIPAILYYYHSDTANNGWYGTNAEATELFGSTDYNDRAAAGLRLHFDKISFSYQESGTSISLKNTGIFRKVGRITSGSSISLASAFLEGGATSVRNVTEDEIVDSSVGTSSVRYLLTLASESMTGGYTSSTYNSYWTSSTFYSSWYTYALTGINGDGSLWGIKDYNLGVRPVVSLPSSVTLTKVTY